MNNKPTPILRTENIKRPRGAEALPYTLRRAVKAEPRYTGLSFVDQRTLSQRKYNYKVICMLYHSISVFDVPNGIILRSLRKNQLHVAAFYIGMISSKNVLTREQTPDPSFRECAQSLLDLFIASGHAAIDPKDRIGPGYRDAMAKKRKREYDSISDADLVSFLESFQKQRKLIPERIEWSNRTRHEMEDAIVDYFGKKYAAAKSEQ